MRTSLLAIVLVACASAPPPAPVSPAPPSVPPAPQVATELPSMAASPAAEPALPSPPQGGLEHAMQNCPVAVAGATTRMTNTPSGVDLTITADDPASQRRIIELAALHERMGDPDTPAMRHTGLHGGPGGLGHCPVIHAETTVTFTRIRRGTVIHLRAVMPSDVPRVQAIVAERLAYVASR